MPAAPGVGARSAAAGATLSVTAGPVSTSASKGASRAGTSRGRTITDATYLRDL